MKNRSTLWSNYAYHSWVPIIQRNICLPMFIVQFDGISYIKWAAHSWLNEENMHNRILFSHMNRMRPCIDHRDVTGGHYVKSHMPGAEYQELHVLCHMWKLKKENSLDVGSWLLETERWGGWIETGWDWISSCCMHIMNHINISVNPS